MENDDAMRILRGVLSLGRRLRAERADGAASPAAVALLGALYRLGPVPAVQLAADQRLQPQSLTRLLAALEDKGLISRQPGSEDRRERVIALTRRGRAVFGDDMRDRRRWLEGALAETLTARERAALLEAADAMLKLATYEPAAAARGSRTRARVSGAAR